MAEYIEDYSNLNAASAGLQGFLQGMERGQDRQMKQQEFEAKRMAQEEQMKRTASQAALDQIRTRKMQADAEQAEYENTLESRQDAAITKFAPTGLMPQFGDTGHISGTTPNMNSPVQIKAQETINNDMSKQGKMPDPDNPGQFIDRPRSQREIGDMKFKGKLGGYDVNVDENGNYVDAKIDPQSLKMKALADRETQNKLNNQYKADANTRANSRQALMQDRFDENQNKNASAAGMTFEHDKILQQMKGTKNSLNRAKTLLDGDTPINAKNLNLVQQDIISATAPGGVVTEGKMDREVVDNWALKLSELRTKMGNTEDVRKSNPELIKQFKGLINEIDNEYTGAMAKQAVDLHNSFKYNSNPKVKETIKGKLQRYAPSDYAEIYGEQPGESVGLVKPGLIANPTGKVGASPAQAKPKTVIQNGHTFTLNPVTGEYE